MKTVLGRKSVELRRLYYGEHRGSSQVRSRLLYAGFALFVVFVIGTTGYWFIGEGNWSVGDCAYMVLITITSVGYAEVLPVSAVDQGRIFTMGLLVFGMGVSFYFLSALTAFIIEGDLREALWRRRMFKKLKELKKHYIVCGVGRVGRSVVEELVHARKNIVCVDKDKKCLDRVIDRWSDQVFAIYGDATEDNVLRDAGVVDAEGLVTALQHDKDNLYVALSARQLNGQLRVVSRYNDDRAAGKLQRAGANFVISPTTIGGRRMAHELLHPNVVGFLDLAVQGRGAARNLAVQEVPIPAGSSLVGKQLARSNIRQVSNALVLAVFEPGDGQQTYNPPADYVLDAGMVLVVLGERDAIERLNDFVGH